MFTKLPSKSCIIQAKCGDGFAVLLPSIVGPDDIIVTSTYKVDTWAGRSSATVTSLSKLHTLVCLGGPSARPSRVIIDCDLPSLKTMQAQRLKQLCDGAVTVFTVHPGFDRLDVVTSLVGQGVSLPNQVPDYEWVHAELARIFNSKKGVGDNHD
jgi:hypothetical protein